MADWYPRFSLHRGGFERSDDVWFSDTSCGVGFYAVRPGEAVVRVQVGKHREDRIMQTLSNVVSRGLEGFWKGVVFSVEHMSVTQWAILGSLSVIVGFLLLRTQRI